MAKITVSHRSVLSHVKDDDAYWTSDIAWASRLMTKQCLKLLKEAEAEGLVKRIVPGGYGRPSSWLRTPAGAKFVREG